MTLKSPSTARTLLVWGVSLIAFVVTLEVCIRVEDTLRWGAPLVGVYTHDALFTIDSLGWHPKPGAEYQKWTINSAGFRGPEIEQPKPSDVIRIVALGSSETFGQSESSGNEFPRVLERALNRRATEDPELSGMRFEVLNAGIPGMSVARIPDYWNQWAGSFDADAVLIYPSPAFYLDAEPPSRTFAPPAAAGAQKDSPRVLPKTREVINRFLPERVEAVLKRFLIERTVSGHEDSWVWEDVPTDRLTAYLEDVDHLVSTVSASGAGVVLATHASAIERPLDAQASAVLLGWRKFFPRASPDVILDFEERANEETARMLTDQGVQVVRTDLGMPADPSLFSDHAHFTDAGATVFTDLLLDTVLNVAVDHHAAISSADTPDRDPEE